VRLRRVAPLPLIVWACLTGGPSAAPPLQITDLLDRYVAGQFDAAVSQISERTDFEDLLDQLQRNGPAWIDARGPDERPRRELAAATFALEAARIGEWHEWKWVQRRPETLAILSWKPAPLLIEWGCARFREAVPPHPIERWWQLAALAVAQRGEDPQFLVGDLNIGLGHTTGEIGNPDVEIRHLDHIAARFPSEPRFTLAHGIAREWHSDAAVRAKAMEVFGIVKDDLDVGAEATMRQGAMTLRDARPDNAIASFSDADRLSRDPYVVYLARYFKGQAYERLRRSLEAEIAYRAAVTTIPDAQSASMALATLLFAREQRAEAQRLAVGALSANPQPADPWREYAHADDRFWSELLGRLRAEIRK